MTSAVSRSIVTALCENQGCMDFKRLDHLIRQEFTVAESVLLRLLCDEEKFSIQEGQENSSGYAMSPDSVIVAKTSLRLCQKPPAECSSSHCNHLHLCRYFVCGHCRFGNKCKNNHSLDSPDSGTLLKKLDLQHLTNKQLFQLLLQNDPYLLPEICPHYNKGIGEHGSCRFGSSCSNLHLCLHNARGDCKFGPTCKRAHTVGEHILKILNGRGLGQENIQNLEKIYRNKFIILGHREQRKPFAPPAAVCPAPCPAPPPVSVPHTRHPSSSATSAPGATRTRHPSSSATSAPGATRTRHPSSSATSAPGATSPISETERNEICLYFIRRHCSFKEKCARVHYHLPYKWQVLDSDGSWKDLANMEDIEEAYCDAAKDTNCPDEPPLPSLFTRLLNLTPSPAASSDKRWVNFVTMTCGGSPVRRLSTASSVSKPPHYILTTQWMWYWKDETGIWMEYGAGGDRSASVTSLTLENVYLADADIEISFGAGKQKYILSCKDMQQQNVHYKTKREVRRRPRFVSSHEVEAKLKSVSSESASSSSSVAVPQHWDKTALPEISFTLIAVTNSMKEHKMIEQLFKRTMEFRTIYSIKRIQNPSLWRVFQWQKEQMQKKNVGKPVNEQYLFHGTDESLLDAICEQNFDWRMCGVHGTAYGKGSYFARDASYSDRYTKAKPGSQRKFMFVVLVLVGDSTKASSCYVRPPAKGDGKGFYDSCVDSRSNPSIFVIFDKLQIYPEYIVEYV